MVFDNDKCSNYLRKFTSFKGDFSRHFPCRLWSSGICIMWTWVACLFGPRVTTHRSHWILSYVILEDPSPSPKKTHKRFKATVATFVFVGNFDVLQVHHMTFQDKYVFTFSKGACQLFFQRFGEWEIRYDDSSKKAKGRHLKLRKPEARIAWVLRVSIHCV